MLTPTVHLSDSKILAYFFSVLNLRPLQLSQPRSRSGVPGEQSVGHQDGTCVTALLNPPVLV